MNEVLKTIKGELYEKMFCDLKEKNYSFIIIYGCYGC